MRNTANGARESRQTIFFPPEGETGESDCPQDPVRLSPAGQVDTAKQLDLSPPAVRFSWMRNVAPSANGTVFRAEEAETGKLVTVELLSETAAQDKEHVNFFYLEAEAAALLQHPHIARGYAAEPYAGSHMRRTSHLPGGETLREMLTKGGWFEPPRALQIIAQVADALAYAHDAGVLHLNLQPENIWLDSNDRVLITGFGIADEKQLEWARHLRARACAPSYLSPEQFNGQAGDRASDLYALGAILYEMLTDRVPFDSNDLEQLQHRHKTRMPRPPHELNHQLTPELSLTVMELLDRNPETRLRKFAEANLFNSVPVRPVPDQPMPAQDAAPAVAGQGSARQRMTNPMPLSELAAEVNASSTALVARPINKLAGRRFLSFTQHASQWRNRRYVRTGLAILSLAMLSGFLVLAIQGLSSWRKVPVSPEQPNRSHSATGESAPGGSSSTAPEAAPPKPAGSIHEHSGSPVKAERTEAITSSDEVTAPSGSLRAKGGANTGNFAFGAAIKRVSPAYPSSARARRVADEVVVDVFVNEKGKVMEARAVSGPGLFRASAVDAARQWRFAPTTFNDVPVKVHRMITFRYNPVEQSATKQNQKRARFRSQDPRPNTPRAGRKSGNKIMRPLRSMVRKFKN